MKYLRVGYDGGFAKDLLEADILRFRFPYFCI